MTLPVHQVAAGKEHHKPALGMIICTKRRQLDTASYSVSVYNRLIKLKTWNRERKASKKVVVHVQFGQMPSPGAERHKTYLEHDHTVQEAT